MTIDLDELERLAKAAQPWRFTPRPSGMSLVEQGGNEADAVWYRDHDGDSITAKGRDIMAHIAAANLRKAPGGKVARRPDGKVLKPEGWVPANVGAVLERASAAVAERDGTDTLDGKPPSYFFGGDAP